MTPEAYTALKDDLRNCLDTHNVSEKSSHEEAHSAINQAYAEKKAGSADPVVIRDKAKDAPYPIYCQNVWTTESTPPIASVPEWPDEDDGDIPIEFGAAERHFVYTGPSSCWYYWNGSRWKRICW